MHIPKKQRLENRYLNDELDLRSGREVNEENRTQIGYLENQLPPKTVDEAKEGAYRRANERMPIGRG